MCREGCCGHADINSGDAAGARGMVHAVRNDFLAATHIVLLREDRFFATLADLWEILRHELAAGLVPWNLCLAACTSRTAVRC